MIEVIITKIPMWSYGQWLLLGLYRLQEEKKIKLRFKVNFPTRISLTTNNKYILYLAKKRHFNLQFKLSPIEGYVIENGRKKAFCLDFSDGPHAYSSELLDKVDVYFKMQCPKNFHPKGFQLTDKVTLPWIDYTYVKNDKSHFSHNKIKYKPCENLLNNLHKIKPAMVGPRRLTYGNTYKALQKAYKNYLKSSEHTPWERKKLMTYFGSDKGPKLIEKENIQGYYAEADVVSRFSEEACHPNEKRGIAADILSQMGEQYDIRVIEKNGKRYPELEIPLPNFCNHIAKFEYNLNISGNQLSIPNRFIESFMAGTAIVTDKLHLKWYLPFDEEIVETVEMGYYPNEQVDWEQFKQDIMSLPKVRKEDILDLFEKKWSPKVFAEYIVNTVKTM